MYRYLSSMFCCGLVLMGCGTPSPQQGIEVSATEVSATRVFPVLYNWSSWDQLGGNSGSVYSDVVINGVGLNAQIAEDPVVVQTNETRVDVFIVGTNNQAYHRFWDWKQSLPFEQAWQPDNWEGLGAGLPNKGGLSGLVAVPYSGGVELFATNSNGTSGELVNISMDSSGHFGSWQDLGQWIDGKATVATRTVTEQIGLNFEMWNEIDVAARQSDNSIWFKSKPGNNWADWRQIPGKTNHDPVLFAVGNQLELMVRGVDDGLYRQWRTNNNAWQPNFQALGGSLRSVPSVTGSSATDITVVADLFDGIRAQHFDGKIWSGWTPINAQAWSDPAIDIGFENVWTDPPTWVHAMRPAHNDVARPIAFSNGPGAVNVVLQGTNRGLWVVESYAPGSWGLPYTIAPCMTTNGTPAIAYTNSPTGPNVADLVIIAHDQSVWHSKYTHQPPTGGPVPPACASGNYDQECGYGGACPSDAICTKAEEQIGGATLTNEVCKQCGGTSQPCCPGTGCASTGDVCFMGRCEACGGYSALCCPGNTCQDGKLTCQKATWYDNEMRCFAPPTVPPPPPPCGGQGQACCPSSPACPGANGKLVCSGTSCEFPKPSISVSSMNVGKDAVFTVTGSGFPSSNQIVTTRVVNDALNSATFTQSESATGTLNARFSLPCISGQALHFSATDGTLVSINIDASGTLWSNDFTISCP